MSIRYEINGHVVEAEKPLSNDEIDEIGQGLQQQSNAKRDDWYTEVNKGNTDALALVPKIAGMLYSDKVTNAAKDLGQNILGVGQSIKAGLMDVPFAAAKLPAQLLEGTDLGKTDLANFTHKATQGMAEGIKDAVQHPIDTIDKKPLTTAMYAAPLVDGSLFPKNEMAKATPQAEMKPSLEDITANLEKQKAPLKGQIEEDTQRVMDSLDNTVKKYGDKLNKAKKDLGLPVTNEEREASIANTGNPHNFETKNPNVKPYLKYIEEPKKQSDLVTTITEFKREAKNIADPKIKAQLASILQDHINTMVDWTKSGTTTEGVLKSQYKDLKQLALPDTLKESKAMMADALNLSDELSSKLEDPGKAEAFLRNIVTSKSARVKDNLMSIRHLEEMSGTPIFDSIKKAIQTEKAVDTQLAQLRKLKKPEIKTDEGITITPMDLAHINISGWRHVVKLILASKDKIKDMVDPMVPYAKRAAVSTTAGTLKSLAGKPDIEELRKTIKQHVPHAAGAKAVYETLKHLGI